MRPYRFVVWLAVAGVVAAAGWWWWHGRAPEVRVAVAARGTAVEIVYATGAVEPVRWSKVASVIRDRIIEICHCEGQEVTKGQVLARLDDREISAQLQELKAREEFSKRELSRVTELIARNVATTQAHDRASSDLRQIQALISVQMERLGDYTVNAPMDGVVLRRDGEIGEIAEQGQILFWVGVPKPLQVVAEVNEEDIPRVAVGQTVLFRTDAFPDRRLTGTVRDMTPMGDPVTKTYRIKVALAEDTPLRPGMSVEANVVTREKADALLVPKDAVDGTTVFVVSGDRVERRRVTLGIRGTRAVEVLAGVTDGDRVVSPLTAGLADGGRVRVVAKPAEAP